MIIAGCLFKSVTPRVCAPDRETPLSMSTEERWTTLPEFSMRRRRCRPFEKKRQPIAIGVFIHSTFATDVCRAVTDLLLDQRWSNSGTLSDNCRVDFDTAIVEFDLCHCHALFHCGQSTHYKQDAKIAASRSAVCIDSRSKSFENDSLDSYGREHKDSDEHLKNLSSSSEKTSCAVADVVIRLIETNMGYFWRAVRAIQIDVSIRSDSSVNSGT